MISANPTASAVLEKTKCTGKVLHIKRMHGLGNVLCLLPVLDRLKESNFCLNVITRPEWAHPLSVLRPDVTWNQSVEEGEFVDLDSLTESMEPREHRTDDLGRLLGAAPPFETLRLTIPHAWSAPFEGLRGSIVFAPEGGHPSRQWPTSLATTLHHFMPSRHFVLVGMDPKPRVTCDVDLRGKLRIQDLFGVLSVAETIITMDSGVLHIAAALDKPTVAVFGGIDPAFRVRTDQPVVSIQAKLECSPCNKKETCHEEFFCIRGIQPEHIAQAVELSRQIHQSMIYRVAVKSESAAAV